MDNELNLFENQLSDDIMDNFEQVNIQDILYSVEELEVIDIELQACDCIYTDDIEEAQKARYHIQKRLEHIQYS